MFLIQNAWNSKVQKHILVRWLFMFSVAIDFLGFEWLILRTKESRRIHWSRNWTELPMTASFLLRHTHIQCLGFGNTKDWSLMQQLLFLGPQRWAERWGVHNTAKARSYPPPLCWTNLWQSLAVGTLGKPLTSLPLKPTLPQELHYPCKTTPKTCLRNQPLQC